MKITHINNTDIPGRIFNGYDIMNTLNEHGHEVSQIVIDKLSNNKNVYELLSPKEKHIKNILSSSESMIGAVNLLFPYADKLMNHPIFQQADIIHYHLLHNQLISMYDLNKLLKSKPCVWTLHDPWIFTGHCVHPLDCDQWKTGCKKCSRPYDAAFPLYHNSADQMWQIKYSQLDDVDIDLIVSTEFMYKYIKESPITSHFTHIHKIPFGLDLTKLNSIDKKEAKRALGISEDSFTIGVRDEANPIKGIKYLIDALKIVNDDNITIISVGSGDMLSKISEEYHHIHLGWQNDPNKMDLFYSASNIFVMPSLAESFGLMSIEAMAHETMVICFENTVLPEIVHSEKSGIAVKYKNSEELAKAIIEMKNNIDECNYRGQVGRKIVENNYRYEEYIKRHIDLYNNILKFR